MRASSVTLAPNPRWPASRARAPAMRSSRRCSNAVGHGAGRDVREQLVRELPVGAGEHGLGGRGDPVDLLGPALLAGRPGRRGRLEQTQPHERGEVLAGAAVRHVERSGDVDDGRLAASPHLVEHGALGGRHGWWDDDAGPVVVLGFGLSRHEALIPSLHRAGASLGHRCTLTSCDVFHASSSVHQRPKTVPDGALARRLARSLALREDQVDVAELMPSIPCSERRPVRKFQRAAAGDRLEHLQVAGLGFVPAGEQAVDDVHAA